MNIYNNNNFSINLNVFVPNEIVFGGETGPMTLIQTEIYNYVVPYLKNADFTRIVPLIILGDSYYVAPSSNHILIIQSAKDWGSSSSTGLKVKLIGEGLLSVAVNLKNEDDGELLLIAAREYFSGNPLENSALIHLRTQAQELANRLEVCYPKCKLTTDELKNLEGKLRCARNSAPAIINMYRALLAFSCSLNLDEKIVVVNAQGQGSSVQGDSVGDTFAAARNVSHGGFLDTYVYEKKQFEEGDTTHVNFLNVCADIIKFLGDARK